jgi:hypothetical protein
MRWLTIVAIAGLVAVPALADWNDGDPYKMHYPQLPDPDGWDVNVTRTPGVPPYRVVADDWQCSESGPVTDIHFWGSWEQDVKGTIDFIDVAIYSDVPSGTEGQASHPGQVLWTQAFHQPEYTERFWGSGDQGWYDPFVDPPTWTRPDHQQTWQYNIANIPVPGAFEQVQGQIYWLAISVRLAAGPQGQFGWKTSLDHFNDDATWVDLPPSGPVPWNELRDPVTFDSLDMAFVITPEPATLLLLSLGGLALRRR